MTTRFTLFDGQIDYESQHGAASTFFVYIDKKTRRADTIKAEVDEPNCENCIIRDLTGSLGLTFPLIQIVKQGDDIYYNNCFVGVQDGKFKTLFSIDDTRDSGVVLRRVNEWTLAGESSGRDEVMDEDAG